MTFSANVSFEIKPQDLIDFMVCYRDKAINMNDEFELNDLARDYILYKGIKDIVTAGELTLIKED